MLEAPFGLLLLGLGGLAGVALLVAFVIAALYAGLTFSQWIVDRRLSQVEPSQPSRAHADALASTFVHELVSTGSLLFLHPIGLIDPPSPSERILREGRPILLVHGYLQARTSFILLGPRLSGFGLGPIYSINLRTLEESLEEQARALSHRIDQIRRATGARQVDVVAHSTGGLVARVVDRGRREPRIRRLVTLGTPHRGTQVALALFGAVARDIRPGSAFLERLPEPPPGQLVSISSAHDFVVIPPENAYVAPRGRDVVVRHVGHHALLTDPDVGLEVVKALGEDIHARRAQPIFEVVEAPEPELAAQL